MLGQVLTRPTGMLLGFEISQNPFVGRPSYQKIARCRSTQRMRASARARRSGRACWRKPATAGHGASRLRDGTASFRSAIRRITSPRPTIASPHGHRGSVATSVNWPTICCWSTAARRSCIGRCPTTPMATSTPCRTCSPIRDHCRSGRRRRACRRLCDASCDQLHADPLDPRPHPRRRLPVPWAVKRLTRDSAPAIGLHDRGLVASAKGRSERDRLRSADAASPKVVYDLPSGGQRLVQRTEGYDATIVSGVPVYRDGEATGALPGRLVRGPQAAPR